MSTEQQEAQLQLGGASLIDIKRIAGQTESAAITARCLTDKLANAHLELQKQNVRQHALIVQLSNALMNAHDHIEMDKLRRSHATDADRICRAIADATQYLKGPKP